MRLPEFVLLVAATVAAIAAGLAVVASKYGIARALFWIAALSFGSLGVMWSASSEGYSLPTQLIVSAIIGAIAAAGLTWGLWEINEKETTEIKPTAPPHAELPPTPPSGGVPGMSFTNSPGFSVKGVQILGYDRGIDSINSPDGKVQDTKIDKGKR
jgi:hypothetical protein